MCRVQQGPGAAYEQAGVCTYGDTSSEVVPRCAGVGAGGGSRRTLGRTCSDRMWVPIASVSTHGGYSKQPTTDFPRPDSACQGEYALFASGAVENGLQVHASAFAPAFTRWCCPHTRPCPPHYHSARLQLTAHTACSNRPSTTQATIHCRTERLPVSHIASVHPLPVQGWVTYKGEEDTGAVIFNSLKHPWEYEKQYE